MIQDRASVLKAWNWAINVLGMKSKKKPQVVDPTSYKCSRCEFKLEILNVKLSYRCFGHEIKLNILNEFSYRYWRHEVELKILEVWS